MGTDQSTGKNSLLDLMEKMTPEVVVNSRLTDGGDVESENENFQTYIYFFDWRK